MPKTVNFKDSVNMCYAVAGSYVTKKEVNEFFKANFPEDKEFTKEELQEIVRYLIDEKKRNTTKMKNIAFGPLYKNNTNKEKDEKER